MEIELIEQELFEMEDNKAETIRKIIYAVEWHWELCGDQIPFDFVIDKVNEQMERERWLYDAVDCFYDECENAYLDIVDDLFNK